MVTIPRLELTAALVSARVSARLKFELDHQGEEYFWTDSKVVLGYLKNEAKCFHVFVANRVQEIRTSTESSRWHYVPSDQNPADITSRGCSSEGIRTSCWIHGPPFLQQPDLEISLNESVPDIDPEDPEVKASSFQTRSTEERPSILERLARFSEWTTIVKVIQRLKRSIRAQDSHKPSTERQRAAEIFILKLLQAAYFETELKALSSGDHLKRSSVLFSLDAFLDTDGLLRVGGRLGNSSIPYAVKKPIILPKRSHITRVLAAHFHKRIQHQGRGQTLNHIREHGYWIIGGSSVVKDTIAGCITCHRLRRPPEHQKMADLPAERLEQSPLFCHVGIDCFGPFMIQRGRSAVKRYGLIVTCLYSRAVHLEPLDDLSTDCFLNCLRCIIAIRGKISTIRCDQGTNFIGASRQLNLAKVERHLAESQDC